MKRIVWFIFFKIIAIQVAFLSAQVDDGYIYYEDQYSPYEYYSPFPSQRQALDSFKLVYYDNKGTIGSPVWSYFRQSADRLQDTIYAHYFKALEINIYQYDYDGKLMNIKSHVSGVNAERAHQINFIYDSVGRVIKMQLTGNNSSYNQNKTVVYDYENRSTTCLDTFYGHPREQVLIIHPRDYGYVCYERYQYIRPNGSSSYEEYTDSIIFQFDSQKRLVKHENQIAREYKKYSYFDDGYTFYSSGSIQNKYYFDNHQRLVKKEFYSAPSEKPDHWYIYQYYPTSEVPGGVAPVEAPKQQAYGVQGGVVVEAHSAANVQVYNLMGRLISQQSVGLARTEIPLPRGIYIVTVGGQSQKVVVR